MRISTAAGIIDLGILIEAKKEDEKKIKKGRIKKCQEEDLVKTPQQQKQKMSN